MGRHRRAIGAFPNQRAAEEALSDLRASGFPMERVSIVARGPQPREERAHTSHVGNKSDEGAISGAITGGLLGTLTGLLVGLGTLAIPGVGPIMLAGAIATAVATTLAGTGIGAVAGGLLGALIGLGIPERDARHYHDRIMRGEYLLVVDGSDDEIARVEQALHHRRIDAYNVYDAPDTGTRTLEEPYYRHSRHHHANHHPMAGSSVVVHETPGPHDVHVHDESLPIRSLEEPFYRRSRHSHPGVHQPVVTGAPVPVPVPVPEASGTGVRQRAIASYANRHNAEEAITRLRHANFPLSGVSLIARRIEHRDAFSGLDLRDRLEAARYNIPGNRTHVYDERLDRGDYLVAVSGTEEEIHRAAAILATCGMTSWDVFDSTVEHPATGPSKPDTVVDQPPVSVAGTSPLPPASKPAPPPPPAAMASSSTPVPSPTVRSSSPVPPPPAAPVSSSPVPPSPVTPVSSSAPVPPPPVTAMSSSAPVPPPPVTAMSSSAPVPPPPSTANPSPAAARPSQHYRAIGLFTKRQHTEAALSELKNSGFSMDQVSILARDTGRGSSVAGVDINQHAGNKADEGAKAGATTGAAVGGLGGFLVGLGALAIPGIGPVVKGGAVATAIVTALAGSAIGAAAGGIVGALVGLGIPEHRARIYNERFHRGDDLIIIDGNEADIRRAEPILKRHHIHEWESFEATKVQTHGATTPGVRRDGTVVERPPARESDRLGIRDERSVTERRDRTQQKNIRPNTDPEVIIVDNRQDPRQG
ncbi:hypothetical protein [Leptolyngbya sp. PL-A3]